MAPSTNTLFWNWRWPEAEKPIELWPVDVTPGASFASSAKSRLSVGRVVDLLAVDQAADRGPRFDERAHAADEDGFRHAGDGQADVERRFLADAEHDLALRRREPLQLDRELVSARREIRQVVLAASLGGTGPRRVGVELTHDNRGARQEAALFVRHFASERGKAGLRDRGAGR